MIEHNQKLHLGATIHMMPSQRKISIVQAAKIDLAYEFGIKLKDSYYLISKKVGDYDNIGFTNQDHKNYL